MKTFDCLIKNTFDALSDVHLTLRSDLAIIRRESTNYIAFSGSFLQFFFDPKQNIFGSANNPLTGISLKYLV